MSRGAKGTAIEQIAKVFEKIDFDEKVKVFEEIRDYMQQETEKKLNELKSKSVEYEKLKASIGQ